MTAPKGGGIGHKSHLIKQGNWKVLKLEKRKLKRGTLYDRGKTDRSFLRTNEQRKKKKRINSTEKRNGSSQ